MNLIHWIWGKPRPESEAQNDLATVERNEQRSGKSTLQGDMLRFEIARRELVAAILRAFKRGA